MQVIRRKFFTLDDALADIRSRGLWPTTYVVDHASEAGLHWHSEDVYGYFLLGSSYALDARATASTSARETSSSSRPGNCTSKAVSTGTRSPSSVCP
jgi:hypothetical protein